MMAMLTERWMARSPRERLLLSVAGVLAALMLVWFALAAPALAARERAGRAYASAADLYEEMTAGAREAARLRLSAPAIQDEADQAPLRTAASALARDFGLQISRIQPGEAGALAFVFETADPGDLFRWIEGLQTRYGVAASTVTLRRNDGARTVQASVLVVEAQ